MRHTAATWLMEDGCDLWTAAAYLGMMVQTLEKCYGHRPPTTRPTRTRRSVAQDRREWAGGSGTGVEPALRMKNFSTVGSYISRAPTPRLVRAVEARFWVVFWLAIRLPDQQTFVFNGGRGWD